MLDLISRDTQLPNLSIALDATRMRSRLTRLLCNAQGPAHPLHVRACAIEHVRYKPGISCMICYRIDLEESATGQRREQRLLARVYGPGTSLRRYRKAARVRLHPPSVGPALAHVDELGMVLWAFPNERKLKGLRALTDDALLTSQVLPTMVRMHWGNTWRLASAQHEIVHYVPEHGCSVRATLSLRAQNSEQRRWQVFGKCYATGQGWRSYRLMQQLWRSPERQSGALQIPQPLLYQRQERLLWQQALPGRTLASALRTDATDHGLLGAAGAQIRTLHNLKIKTASRCTLEEQHARLALCRRMLTFGCTASALELTRLLEDLARMRSNRSSPEVLLHGDLHAKNLMVHGERVALIDFDAFHMGPPEKDLGSFVAALLHRALVEQRNLDVALAQARAFLAGYDQRAGVNARQLNWQIAYALVAERAYRGVSRLKDPGALHLPKCLALARRALSGALEITA